MMKFKAVPVHAMNENVEVNVWLHCLLSIILEGDEW
jgi:hypothetical protein